jgi:hypothetical protein
MFLHPGKELIGMIRLFDSVLSEDGLITFILAKRVTQAERLSKLSRLMDELMNPLKIVGMINPWKSLEERTLANL